MFQSLRQARFAILLLLSLDILFIGLHVLRVLLLGDSAAYWRFGVDEDGGFPEIFQYLKFLLTVGGLFYLFSRQKAWSYSVWALVFTFVFLDDALRLHEILGRRVVSGLELVPMLGLRAQDFGELIVWGVVGSVALGGLLLTYVRAQPKVREVSRHLFYRFAVLAFCGLGLDLVHSALLNTSVRGVAVIEDGGEMLAASFIVTFVWSVIQGVRAADQQVRRPAERVRKTAF